jgi:capsular polysaccharide biosynthesis protein
MLDNQDKKFEISKAQPANIKPQDTIDLLELFYVLKKKILLILMAALIGGCVAGVYTQFFMTPVYSSMSSILVLSKETTLTSLADLQLGASLTSDYTVLIKSTPVLEQVIENLNLDTTVEELKNQISINNPTDTRILEITVQDTDAGMAKKVVDEIANVSSDYIGDKI